MTGPLGRSARIWATTGDTSFTLPPGPSGRSQMIRARDADCVPDLPPGPSGRSRIIRLPSEVATAGSCDYFLRTEASGLGDGWSLYGTGSASDASVDGDDAVFTILPNHGWYPGEYYIEPQPSIDRPIDIKAEFELELDPYPLTGGQYLQFWFMVGDSAPTTSFDARLSVELRVHAAISGGRQLDLIVVDDRDTFSSSTALGVDDYISGVRMMLRWVIDGFGTRVKVWRVSEDEPLAWNVKVAKTTSVGPGKYFAFDGNALDSDAVLTVRVGSICWKPVWSIYSAGCDVAGWPSEPRWGLAGEPSWGFGGPERLMHWRPDPAQTYLTSTVQGAASDWFPADLDYPWGSDPPLLVMDVQQSKPSVSMAVYAWLGDCDWNDRPGTTWFGLLRNGLVVTSDTNSTTSASLLYSGPITAGDRWVVIYYTDATDDPSGSMGAEWWLYAPPTFGPVGP